MAVINPTYKWNFSPECEVHFYEAKDGDLRMGGINIAIKDIGTFKGYTLWKNKNGDLSISTPKNDYGYAAWLEDSFKNWVINNWKVSTNKFLEKNTVKDINIDLDSIEVENDESWELDL